VAVLSTVMQSFITPSGLMLSVSMQNVVAPLQRELGWTESSWQDATQTNSPLPFRLVAGDSLRAQCYKQITVVIYDCSSHGQFIEQCPYNLYKLLLCQLYNVFFSQGQVANQWPFISHCRWATYSSCLKVITAIDTCGRSFSYIFVATTWNVRLGCKCFTQNFWKMQFLDQ